MRWLFLQFAFVATTCHAAAPIDNRGLEVMDETGKPVKQLQIQTQSPEQRTAYWLEDRDQFSEMLAAGGLKPDGVIHVIVRAGSFASALTSFRGDAQEELLRGDAKIVLARGELMRIRLEPAAGRDLPEELSPLVYFAEFAGDIQSGWQPRNWAARQDDHNMLNIREGDAEGEIELRVAATTPPFCVAVHHPGWLRFFEAGPFTVDDFKEGKLTIKLPLPASVAPRLDTGSSDPGALPFDKVNYQLMRQIDPRGNSYLHVGDGAAAVGESLPSVDDLAPGTYMMTLTTQPKGSKPDMPRAPDDVDPGRFMAQKPVDLAAGQRTEVGVGYAPFDPEAIRGTRTARIAIRTPAGDPAAGKPVKVLWFDGAYGNRTAFDGPVPEDGTIVLKNVTDKALENIPFGPFAVKSGKETLGFFRLKAVDKIQEFEFWLIPKEGDDAPDIELVDVKSGETIHLADFRGKAVFLEFWTVGCGPCQPTMAKLNEDAAAHSKDWADVAVMAVALDKSRDLVAKHVKSRGWSTVPNYWSPHTDGAYMAAASTALGIYGYPTGILLDRDGRIVWRGHPGSIDLAEKISALNGK